ncbi:FtsB family cell division protein [Desulfofalx alkaliphila]|uniref:FtsB family cell division protein n=1 Tax=Desulfofalx alkaliphila TaxID=105483 RepID=UPI00069074C5|nr:septum formation initiator family protein [Desulfofalx alkaliphila]
MISTGNKRGKLVSLKRNDRPGEDKLPPKRRGRNRINVPFIVIAAVFVYLALSLGGEVQKLNTMRHNVAELEQEIESLHVKNEELYKTIEMIKSNDYVEQVARENLGLIKPGESVVVPVEQQGDETSQHYTVRDADIKD